MATRAAALLVVMAVSGCKYGPDAFNCTDDTSCGAAGRCEANHACSFPDTACDSGWKYGELGGASSGKCVGDEQVPDAGIVMIDAPSGDVGPADARVCFGSAPFTVCLASAPTASLTLATTSPIDTASSALCVATVSGATNYCVLAGTVITIEGKLRATGTKPLVMIASDSITVTGTIDVGSHRGGTPETGAGADPGSCATGTLPGAAGGGGAGGSFAGLGGNGGNGGNGGTGGVAGAASGTVTTVRGGCPGQDGQGILAGAKGHGGGAVLLIAGNQIDVQASAVINAAGEGGTGGTGNNFTGNAPGGGGAGAGGMIGLDAPAINCASGALLLATGGGGGEGGINTPPFAGKTGADPTTTTAASGGTGLPDGGDGGQGSIDAATAGGTGGAGDPDGTVHGGGGGGGGGAGLIKVISSGAFCTQLAPPATR